MIIGAPIAGVVCAINWRLQFYVAIVLMVIGLVLYLVSSGQRRGMTQDQLREGVFHGMEERKHQA